MKKFTRIILFLSVLFISAFLFAYCFLFIFQGSLIKILSDWVFILLVLFYLLSIEELYRWVLNDRRSELSDVVAILLFFFLILFISRDFLTSIMGSFSIYLWFAIYELREYPVLNKVLIISLSTYNIIFVSGLISSFTNQPIILNTAYAFSFWVILGLGFLLFGRKYLVIWRFMSPEYLTLFLYIIAWLGIVFINEYTALNFIGNRALLFSEFNPIDFFFNIYFILIAVNWIIYFVSGPILDSMLGIKKIENNQILNLVENVKKDLGIKGRVKVGFGKYPIINAMAYGSFLDKRIAIISEDIENLPEDEIKGIVAHELSHTKGNHTMILTLITSLDLIFRMLLGIPATFYDYTFGNPQLPLIGFIILNFGIYILLFIFVRILEAKADLRTKKKGYSKELIKALYNLESFYATGREIGLNTMLLCEEKITNYNKLVNYIDTAEYLNKSIIKPSKVSLLSTLINSHPPTYYRIAAVLDDRLKPLKEAILPFICLKNSIREKYAKLFEKSRLEFSNLATIKFENYFRIPNIAEFFKEINRKEIFKLEIGNQYLFQNKINKSYKLGKIIDIKFQNDICNKDLYIVKDTLNNEILELNASLYEKLYLPLPEDYYFDKEGILQLKDIEFNSTKTEGTLKFLNQNGKFIKKNLKKTKIPNPISTLQKLEKSDVFFILKGRTNIYNCEKVGITSDFKESYLQLQEKTDGGTVHIIEKLKNLIIKPKDVYLIIRKNNRTRIDELKIIDWIKSKQLRTYFHLKKPINNIEIGYIQDLDFKFKRNNKTSQKEMIEKESHLIIKNIFQKIVNIPYNRLEMISFEYTTATLQKKSETSFFSKMGYKILKRFKPQKIIYL